MQRRPELFPRPRGRLHWEPPLAQDDLRKLAHACERAGREQYILESKEELIETASAIRAGEQPTTEGVKTEAFPILNREWLAWLDNHGPEFRDRLKNASTLRSHVNHRINADGAALLAAPRLYPRAQAPELQELAQNIQQCRQDWFALSADGGILPPFFCATLRGQSMAVALQQSGQNLYRLVAEDIDIWFQPLGDVVGQMVWRLGGPTCVDQVALTLVQLLPRRSYLLTVSESF